jgi:hypothetical protein
MMKKFVNCIVARDWLLLIEDIPSHPRNVNLSLTDSGLIAVRWDMPQSRSSAVQFYKVFYSAEYPATVQSISSVVSKYFINTFISLSSYTLIAIHVKFNFVLSVWLFPSYDPLHTHAEGHKMEN